MTEDLTTGADFGRATASWFGLDPDKVSADLKLAHGQNDVLSVTLTIMLGADDIAGIGKRMKEIAAGSNGIVDFSTVPYPVPGGDELRAEYNALLPAQRKVYGSFAAFVAAHKCD